LISKSDWSIENQMIKKMSVCWWL